MTVRDVVTLGHIADAPQQPAGDDLSDWHDEDYGTDPKNECDASQIDHTAISDAVSGVTIDDISLLGEDEDDLWRWRSVGGHRFARMMGSGARRKILKARGETGENLTYVTLEDLSDERQQQYYEERNTQGERRAALGRGWKAGHG